MDHFDAGVRPMPVVQNFDMVAGGLAPTLTPQLQAQLQAQLQVQQEAQLQAQAQPNLQQPQPQLQQPQLRAQAQAQPRQLPQLPQLPLPLPQQRRQQQQQQARQQRKAASNGSAKEAAPRTTLMLRNLPDGFTRADLLSLLHDQGFAGRYDFLYMPIDFRTHVALGYAFVNMVAPLDAIRLREQLDGFTGWSMPSTRACNTSWSQPHQGLEAHVARYRNSPLMHESVPDEYRPVLMSGGVRVPFPPPTKKIKPPRQGTERLLVGNKAPRGAW